MEVCMNRLIKTLQRTSACTPPQSVTFNGEINPYLFEHYLTPFFEGTVPCIGDLDFSQFTVEDVHEFNLYLDYASQTSAKLLSYLHVFINAEPIAQQHRAFC